MKTISHYSINSIQSLYSLTFQNKYQLPQNERRPVLYASSQHPPLPHPLTHSSQVSACWPCCPPGLCKHTHVTTHTRPHTHTHTLTHTHVLSHTHTHNTHIHAHGDAHTPLSLSYTRKHAHTHTHARTRTYTHTHNFFLRFTCFTSLTFVKSCCV